MMSEAWAMTRGELLYRDIHQIHAVLNFAVFAPFFAWLPPGAAPHAVKAFNALLVLGGAWLARGLVRRWTGDRDGGLVAGMLFVWTLGREWALSSYGEFYALFPVLLSVLLMSRPAPRWTLVGMLWGAAFFLKQTAVFDALALAGGWLLLSRPRLPEAAAAAAKAACGALAVAAAVAAYFAWAGGLREAFDSMFLRALAYRDVRAVGVAERLALFGRLMAAPLLLSLAPCALAAAAGLAWARRAKAAPGPARFPVRLCLVWLAVGLWGVWNVGKMHLHYGLPLVSPACLLAGALLGVSPPARRGGAGLAAAAALLLLAAAQAVPRLRALAAERWVPPMVRGSAMLAEAVKRHSTPKERIFLFGIHNLDVFYLSERLSANGVYMYLSMEQAFLHDRERVERHRRELLEHPPALILVNNEPGFRGASPESIEFFARLTRERYLRVESFGAADFYRIKGPNGAPLPRAY